MSRTVHPSFHRSGDRLRDIGAGKQVFTQQDIKNSGRPHPLHHCVSTGTGMAEKILFCHATAVIPGYLGQSFVLPQLAQAILLANLIDLLAHLRFHLSRCEGLCRSRRARALSGLWKQGWQIREPLINNSTSRQAQ